MSSTAVLLRVADDAERGDAAAFAGRVTLWDKANPVRLRRDAERGLVRMWAAAPFDVLVSRAVRGSIEPADVTVHAGNLLSSLEIQRRASAGDGVDPGPAIDSSWRGQLPPVDGWIAVDDVPASVLNASADEAAARIRANPGPTGGASATALDADAMTVTGNGMRVVVPMRMLLALSGMGFTGAGDDLVRVRATDAWIRLDARFGSVLRRRHALLPLMF